MATLEEIRKLAKLVEWDKQIKGCSYSDSEFDKWLKENRVPEKVRYYSDRIGDNIREVSVIIFDDNGDIHVCPQKVHLLWESDQIRDHHEDGQGVTDFIIELISSGVNPVRFRIIESSRKEVNGKTISYEYREIEGIISREHIDIIKGHLIRKLTSGGISVSITGQ